MDNATSFVNDSFSDRSMTNVIATVTADSNPTVDVALEICTKPDELLLTPLSNVNAGKLDINLPKSNASNQDIDKYNRGRSFYDDINHSKNAVGIYLGLVSAALACSFLGYFILKYREFRRREQDSDFFYFYACYKATKEKTSIASAEIPDEILAAAAYFYAPDISKLLQLKRQLFSWKNREHAQLLNHLHDYLKAELRHKKRENITVPTLLHDLHQETKKRVHLWLEAHGSRDFKPKEVKRRAACPVYTSCSAGHSVMVKADPPKTLLAKLCIAVVQSCFVYWLAMFTFYFVPTVGIGTVVSGVALFPFALTFVVLISLLATVAYKHGQAQSSAKDELKIDKKEKTKLAVLKPEALLYQLSMPTNASLPFSTIKLRREIEAILNNKWRKWFRRVDGAVQGFVNGSLCVFFCCWLLKDTLTLLLGTVFMAGATATSTFLLPFTIFTVIAAVGFATYSAVDDVKKQEEQYDRVQHTFNTLVQQSLEVQSSMAGLSLKQYERFLRRYTLVEPTFFSFTTLKKSLNRALVAIKRAGTGSLFFRLVLWNPISLVVTISVTTVATVHLPLMLTFAAFFVAFYVFSYQNSATFQRVERVVDAQWKTQCLKKEQNESSNNNNKLYKADNPVNLGKSLTKTKYLNRCLNIKSNTEEVVPNTECLVSTPVLGERESSHEKREKPEPSQAKPILFSRQATPVFFNGLGKNANPNHHLVDVCSLDGSDNYNNQFFKVKFSDHDKSDYGCVCHSV